MTLLILGLFSSPIMLSGMQRTLLILPLCLSISVVYKTIRCERLADMPVAALGLWMTIILGMYAVGVGVWLLNLLLV
ncbi:MAG: hypothetical protein IH988_09740 [Planctomycetes bacterium]|nr:hypothetical protein [Planctomycetota bacterium]